VTAAINIQAKPTPQLWTNAGDVTKYALSNEDGIPLTDENGNTLTTD